MRNYTYKNTRHEREDIRHWRYDRRNNTENIHIYVYATTISDNIDTVYIIYMYFIISLT